MHRITLSLLCFFTSTSFAKMTDNYAVVFIFQGSCSYCHQFAPSVTRAASELSLPVYGFTLDGDGIPGFEIPIPATQEIHQTFMKGPNGSNVVPATFLINVNSRKFARISSGFVDYRTFYQGLSNALYDPEVTGALQ